MFRQIFNVSKTMNTNLKNVRSKGDITVDSSKNSDASKAIQSTIKWFVAGLVAVVLIFGLAFGKNSLDLDLGFDLFGLKGSSETRTE